MPLLPGSANRALSLLPINAPVYSVWRRRVDLPPSGHSTMGPALQIRLSARPRGPARLSCRLRQSCATPSSACPRVHGLKRIQEPSCFGRRNVRKCKFSICRAPGGKSPRRARILVSSRANSSRTPCKAARLPRIAPLDDKAEPYESVTPRCLGLGSVQISGLLFPSSAIRRTM